MVQVNYCTRDGRYSFEFNVVRLEDQRLRAFIEESPSYGSRSVDLIETC